MHRAHDRPLRFGFLGTVGYRDAERLQGRLREEIRQGGHDALLLLEHPHVYTLGRSAGHEDILASTASLAARGIEVEECDRGGQVTYHGPGQLVGYPVLDLNPDRRDVRRYVRDLQEVLVETLGAFGVSSTGRMKQPEIGVWVGKRKIASIGVHLSRWITTHGFALNVSTDLDYFRGIVPCGLDAVEMVSVERLTGRRYEMAAVADTCAAVFGRIFERCLVPFSPLPDQRTHREATEEPAREPDPAWAGRS